MELGNAYDKNLKARLQETLLRQLEEESEWSDREIEEKIDAVILQCSKEMYMSGYRKLTLKQELFNSIRRLDLLQELLDDKTITEIMVNGTGDIFYEREGRISRWERRFEDEEKLGDVIQQIVAGANRRVNESSPIVDARLADGSRVNVVLKPVAVNGPILTIRKFPEEPMTMDELIRRGTITQEAADFMKKMILAGYNIFISGGTGSGKTTMLNALMDYVPEDERVITIEDSAELQIRHIPNLVRMEARDANDDGEHAVTIRDLIRSALRMRPDRIIVGEVRGSEAIDMIQAMNTGHDGSVSTGHSNSPRDMLSRLETMVLMGAKIPLEAVRKQIASSIDIIVQLDRMRDKTRKVTEIVEIAGYESGEIRLNPLFVMRRSKAAAVMEEAAHYLAAPEEEGPTETLLPTGNVLIHRRKLDRVSA